MDDRPEGRADGVEPVTVWGAGAMGGSIGAWLVRAGREVLFVDNDEAHATAIRDRGLRITGPLDAFTVAARCVHPDALEPGLGTVLLAVKAHHTAHAIGAIAPLLAADGFVVSVQNGLNERVIADGVGAERTVGCFVNFGADVVEPGVVMRGNRGAVVLGELDGSTTGRILALHRLFQDFEPAAVVTANIHGYLWGKLAYGSMLFATALADASIADVLESRAHRPAIRALAREAMAVAAVDTAADGSLDRLVAFNRDSAKSHSGVWRDLAVRRRKTEVDAQIAPIAELGTQVGVSTPLTRRLVELIHDVELGRRAQSWETLEALGAPG
jgi:2-dehydropantoate 2-reductase